MSVPEDHLHAFCPDCGRHFDQSILKHQRRAGDNHCVLITDSKIIADLADIRERKYQRQRDSAAAKAAALRPPKPEPDPLQDPNPRMERFVGQARGRKK